MGLKSETMVGLNSQEIHQYSAVEFYAFNFLHVRLPWSTFTFYNYPICELGMVSTFYIIISR
jgi:hypothetical protein